MSFCRLYSSAAILPQVVAKLVSVPLGHHRAIFDNWATAATLDLFAKKRKGKAQKGLEAA